MTACGATEVPSGMTNHIIPFSIASRPKALIPIQDCFNWHMLPRRAGPRCPVCPRPAMLAGVVFTYGSPILLGHVYDGGRLSQRLSRAAAAQHERRAPGPILLCMGLFSQFYVQALRFTA